MPAGKNKTAPRIIASDIDVWCAHDALVDLTELVANPRNPNTHPDKQVAMLAKIIRSQGWRQCITISNRSGFIVKGHGRLQAAKLMNVELVPVEYQDYLTEADEYADLIADNRIAELSTVDEDMISELLSDEMFDDFDVELTGFDAEDIGMFDVSEVDPPELRDGDKEPFRQVTFTLHDSQFDILQDALGKAKSEGGHESGVNENSNGNAVSFMAERFLDGRC